MKANSIYSYYERISDRFYVSFCIPMKEGFNIEFIWEPLARKVEIRGFEDFDFFLLGKCRDFEIYEALTGLRIISQREISDPILRHCNSKIFLNNIPAEIKKRGGRIGLNKKIINFIVDNAQRISLRYVVKKP